MNQRGTDFGKGSMSKLILKQALPLSLSQLALLLYNIIDRIYIGHIPDVGTDALTGIGLTFPIITVISAFALLFGQGGTPIFSISRGSGDDDKALKIMCNSFSLLVISSVIITFLSLIFMKPLLYMMGASIVTYTFASEYLKIYIWGTLFTMISSGMNGYITAQGFPKTAMTTILMGSVINILLDPLFIFKLGLGIRGAAVATLISQFISFIWVLLFLFGNKAPLKLQFNQMRLKYRICKNIISMGFTGFVMAFTNSAVQLICNRSLKMYGGDIYVGIMTIVNSVREIMGVAVTGITSGAQPVLGYNYGAKKYDRVRKGIIADALFASIYTAVAWLVVFIFPKFFIGLFSTDPDLNRLAVPYLHIYFMAYVFMALQFTGQSTFMALGKAKPAIFFSIFRKVIVVIPLTIFLPMIIAHMNSGDPIKGIFWAEPISNIIGGSASFITMYFTIFRKLVPDKKLRES